MKTKPVTLTLTWPRVVGMVLCKILDKYVSSYQRWIKSVIRLGNNEVLKTLTKTLTFVDADANANAGGSTIALPVRCSGELKMESGWVEGLGYGVAVTSDFSWGLTVCMLGNLHAFLLFFKKIFLEYHQSVKQLGSRSGLTFCQAWSGSELFAKVISRWQKLPLAGKELMFLSKQYSCHVEMLLLNLWGFTQPGGLIKSSCH